jgi:hypothetical protein
VRRSVTLLTLFFHDLFLTLSPSSPLYSIHRTLIFYQGKFIDSISANNRRRSQTIPQSAVQFVGEKLRRLTLKGQDSLGLESAIKNYKRRLSRMSSWESQGQHSLSRNTSFDSNASPSAVTDQQILSRQVSYHRVNSTPLAAIQED